MDLSETTKTVAAILVLAIVTIETGGIYLTAVARGRVPLTPFQQSFARAGHAHAGVLVMLALLAQIYVDATATSGIHAALARNGIAVAAILMPAGFFFSSIGRERTTANRLIALVWLGAASLAAGLIALGVGLLQAA